MDPKRAARIKAMQKKSKVKDGEDFVKPKLKYTKSLKFAARNFVSHRKGKLEDHYKLGDALGSGAYGDVFVCEHKATGETRACKQVEKSRWSDEINETIVKEIQIVRDLDHPNVLKMYEYFEDERNYYIVTDIYRGGELLDELEENGAFSEKEAAILMNQVVGCINHCHKHGLVHRDLKPENILLEESMKMDDIKVIDFGLAKKFDPKNKDERFTEIVGSPYYIAPEVLQEDYGPKCDVWSCGVIAFIVLSNYAPFDGDTDEEVRWAIERGKFEFDDPIWDGISDMAKDFITQLLEYDEDQRPTASQALAHPWLFTSRIDQAEDYREHNQIAAVALQNMLNFHAASKLKQATCAFIASQLLGKDVKEPIDKLFRALDVDVDGRLSREEIQEGYQTFLKKKLTEEELDEIFRKVNYSGTNNIDYSEFLVASMVETDLLRENRLKCAFDMFDTDGDGMLTPENFKQVLGYSHTDENKDEVESYVMNKIFKEVDANGDGEIDFDEFKDVILKNVAIAPVVEEPPPPPAPKKEEPPKPRMKRLPTKKKSFHQKRVENKGATGGGAAATTAPNKTLGRAGPSLYAKKVKPEENDAAAAGGQIALMRKKAAENKAKAAREALMKSTASPAKTAAESNKGTGQSDATPTKRRTTGRRESAMVTDLSAAAATAATSEPKKKDVAPKSMRRSLSLEVHEEDDQADTTQAEDKKKETTPTRVETKVSPETKEEVKEATSKKEEKKEAAKKEETKPDIVKKEETKPPVVKKEETKPPVVKKEVLKKTEEKLEENDKRTKSVVSSVSSKFEKKPALLSERKNSSDRNLEKNKKLSNRKLDDSDRKASDRKIDASNKKASDRKLVVEKEKIPNKMYKKPSDRKLDDNDYKKTSDRNLTGEKDKIPKKTSVTARYEFDKKSSDRKLDDTSYKKTSNRNLAVEKDKLPKTNSITDRYQEFDKKSSDRKLDDRSYRKTSGEKDKIPKKKNITEKYLTPSLNSVEKRPSLNESLNEGSRRRMNGKGSTDDLSASEHIPVKPKWLEVPKTSQPKWGVPSESKPKWGKPASSTTSGTANMDLSAGSLDSSSNSRMRLRDNSDALEKSNSGRQENGGRGGSGGSGGATEAVVPKWKKPAGGLSKRASIFELNIEKNKEFAKGDTKLDLSTSKKPKKTGVGTSENDRKDLKMVSEDDADEFAQKSMDVKSQYGYGTTHKDTPFMDDSSSTAQSEDGGKRQRRARRESKALQLSSMFEQTIQKNKEHEKGSGKGGKLW